MHPKTLLKRLKNFLAVVTWTSVTVMVLYHIYQSINQAQETANRLNPNLVGLQLESPQKKSNRSF
jgi:hypothetical protein